MSEQTDNLPTVDDFASYPHTDDEVTAQGLAAYLAVEAHWSATLNAPFFQAMMAAEKSGSGPTDAAALYNTNQSLMLAEYGVAFLLRALMRHVPDKADEIAAELWDDWESPPLIALTWPVLESLGGDPQAVGEAALAQYEADRAQDKANPAPSALPLGEPSSEPGQVEPAPAAPVRLTELAEKVEAGEVVHVSYPDWCDGEPVRLHLLTVYGDDVPEGCVGVRYSVVDDSGDDRYETDVVSAAALVTPYGGAE